MWDAEHAREHDAGAKSGVAEFLFEVHLYLLID